MTTRTLILTTTIALLGSAARADEIARMSVGNNGIEAIGRSLEPVISADGNFVAFSSDAQNIVPNDTGTFSDVFVRARFAGTTQRISSTGLGFAGNGQSNKPAISADGRFIAFATDATNLFPNDTNGTTDVVLFDRENSTLVPVSVNAAGVLANGRSSDPSISADGRFVAFTSLANNLLPGANSDTNATGDVFVRDMTTGVVTRASVNANGGQLALGGKQGKISGDGRCVVFVSTDSTLVVAGDTNGAEDVFVRELDTANTIPVSRTRLFQAGNARSVFPEISADGRFVTFQSEANDLIDGDTNGFPDVFLLDRKTLAMERVSEDDLGEFPLGARHPAISANGRFVAWEFQVPDPQFVIAAIAVRDLATGALSIASGNPDAGVRSAGDSVQPALTGDGRTVVFASNCSDLVPFDANQNVDVFAFRFTKFTIGDTLSGQVTSDAELNIARFEGVAGMKVKLDCQFLAGSRLPRITIVDQTNTVVADFAAPANTATFRKKLKLPRDGSFAMVMSTQDGQLSSWRMVTSAKLPKSARSFTKNGAKSHGALGVAHFGLTLLPGARVTVGVRERNKPIDTVDARLVDSRGDELAEVHGVSVDRAQFTALFDDVVALRLGSTGLDVELPRHVAARVAVQIAQPASGVVVFVP